MNRTRLSNQASKLEQPKEYSDADESEFFDYVFP